MAFASRGRFLSSLAHSRLLAHHQVDPMFRMASTNSHRASPAAAAEAIAKGLVEPNSRILIHYKKNLMKRQLTRRIMRRSDLTELRDMIRLYHSKMDGAHVAACLCKLSSLLTSFTYKLTRQDPSSPILPTTSPDSPQAIKTAAIEVAKHLAPIVTLAAWVGTGPFDRNSPPDIERDIPNRLTLLRFDTAATVLWALAKLPVDIRRVVCPGPTIENVIFRATLSNKALHEASPDRISLLLWSLAKLSFSSTICSEAAAIAIPSLALRHPLDSSLIDDFPDPEVASRNTSPYPSLTSISSAVNACLAMTLKNKNRREAYLKQCSPSNLAMFSSSLSALGKVELAITKPLAEQIVTRITNPSAYQPFEAADYVGAVQGMALVLEESFMSELMTADDEALNNLEDKVKILDISEMDDLARIRQVEKDLEASGSPDWETLKRWKHRNPVDPYLKEVKLMAVRYRELKSKGLPAGELKEAMRGEVFKEIKGSAVKVLQEVAVHLSSPARSIEMQGGRGSSWKAEHLVHLASAYAAARVRHDGLLHSIKVAVKGNRERMQPWMTTEVIKSFKTLGQDLKL